MLNDESVSIREYQRLTKYDEQRNKFVCRFVESFRRLEEQGFLKMAGKLIKWLSESGLESKIISLGIDKQGSVNILLFGIHYPREKAVKKKVKSDMLIMCQNLTCL